MKRSFCLVCTLLLVLCAFTLGCKKEPQFVPPAFDAAAVQGTPTVPDGLGYNELDAKGIYKVAVCGEVTAQDGKADIWLTNPASNNVWLKLRIYNAETNELLGETGLIKPGEYVQSVTFYEGRTPESGTAIKMRVMSYEPDTYYSQGEIAVNTVAH